MDSGLIRDGDYSDIPALVGMASEFWQHTVYSEPADPESVSVMAKSCIDNGMMLVLDIGGVQGFICGVIGPLLANHSVTIGTEIAWWVNEDYRRGSNGIKLLSRMEKRAADKGVKYWNMVYMKSSMPETIKAIYDSRGYIEAETVHMRVL